MVIEEDQLWVWEEIIEAQLGSPKELQDEASAILG